MLTSMTGFGASSATSRSARGSMELSVEIKTVNSKFLDISIRSPRVYSSFDAEIQRLLRSRLKRGRVEVSVNLRVIEGKAKEVSVNLGQAQLLKGALENVTKELGLSGGVTLQDLLEFPDWIENTEAEIDSQEEWKHLKRTMEVALGEVVSSRFQEGRSLEDAVKEQRRRFGEFFEKIVADHDRLQMALRERFRERMTALTQLENERLEQEITLWVARSDFQEEMDRIRHHLKTFDDLLTTEGELGRKLEFLVQELHREVNTLGSKCPDAQVTPVVIELKTCIERIREQIQNIE